VIWDCTKYHCFVHVAENFRHPRLLERQLHVIALSCLMHGIQFFAVEIHLYGMYTVPPCINCILLQLNPGLAFSLMPTENFSTEPLNFVAASEEIFNIWTDGVNALLGKTVSNCQTVSTRLACYKACQLVVCCYAFIVNVSAVMTTL